MSTPPRMTRRTMARSGAATLGAAVVAGGLARWLLPGRPAAPPPAWAAGPGLPNARLAAGGAARIEPSVAADPADPARLIAAFRSFRADRIGIATAVSADGGRNWRDNGLLPGLVPDLDGNAVVVFDHAGHGFVAGIEATSGPSRHGTARVWRTADGGRTYSAPVTALAPGWCSAARPMAGPASSPRAGSARPAAPAPWHRSSPPGRPGRPA